MKLTALKGIAHDLANHLDFQIWFGYYKDSPNDILTDVMLGKSPFDAKCVEFFKQRLPTSFDFSRIEKIVIKMHRTMTTLNIKVEVKVDNKEFSYQSKSMMA